MHINKINRKKYIGITCQKPNERWRNGKGYKNGYFASAIKKYGWDNFEHIIICDGLNEEDAEATEINLIKMYHTMDKRYGYNLVIGGNVTTGYHHTDNAKAKMSASKKGLYNGCNNPMYGKNGKLAPAYGLKRSDEFKIQRQAKVIVMDMACNVLYICDSIIQASELTGCDRRSISTVCRGLRKSNKGYKFEYLDKSRLEKSRKDKK